MKIQSLRFLLTKYRDRGKWFQLPRLWPQQRSSFHNRRCSSTGYAISIRFIVLGEARARLIPEQNTRRTQLHGRIMAIHNHRGLTELTATRLRDTEQQETWTAMLFKSYVPCRVPDVGQTRITHDKVSRDAFSANASRGIF